MNLVDFVTSNEFLFRIPHAKAGIPCLLLALFWAWETWHPYFQASAGRLRHAAHNLTLALLNTAILSLLFGSVTVLVAEWTGRNQFGFLNQNHMRLGESSTFVLSIILLDAWMYVWHRANHTIPLLWRFHRMHHSDNRMDVTTATRFHLGEHLGSSILRLGLIPLLGLQSWHIVNYELLVIAITQFHHANISLGKWDWWLRLVVVTPDMHKVHHSRWQPETDSNYSTFFSCWDRLAKSFRMRSDPKSLEFGLDAFDAATWQTIWGMLKTPFVSQVRFNELESGRQAEELQSMNREDKLFYDHSDQVSDVTAPKNGVGSNHESSRLT